MKLKDVIQRLGRAESTRLARQVVEQEGLVWDEGIGFIFLVVVNDHERIPNVGIATDDEVGAIRRWVVKYKKGYEGRASVRVSNLPGTVADPIIEKMIRARLPRVTVEGLEKIKFAHRLEMSAENILGLFLEEYLSINLKQSGWYCAWGESVKSVDFVHRDGRLLQVKNRDNTENSSSSTVRNSTAIEKWYRVKSGRVVYKWDVLNQICNTSLSEDAFSQFVIRCIQRNPASFAVDDNNPWA